MQLLSSGIPRQLQWAWADRSNFKALKPIEAQYKSQPITSNQ